LILLEAHAADPGVAAPTHVSGQADVAMWIKERKVKAKAGDIKSLHDREPC
jgi:hypothetical protein